MWIFCKPQRHLCNQSKPLGDTKTLYLAEVTQRKKQLTIQKEGIARFIWTQVILLGELIRCGNPSS